MIEGFFQLTTALGIVGLAIVYQTDSLIEMFTLNPERKKGLKCHKRSAMKSTVVLGPLYTVTGSMMAFRWRRALISPLGSPLAVSVANSMEQRKLSVLMTGLLVTSLVTGIVAPTRRDRVRRGTGSQKTSR